MTQTITADSQTAKQQELLETAKQFLAGGGLGHFRLPDEVDIVLASASGSHMTDTTGREYIDYVLGSGPMLIGHANPTVIGAAAAQIPKGTTYFLLNEPAIRLAKRLVENVPCGEQVRFQTTGTEATHVALRGARAFTGRGKILKFEGGWHGMHDYSLWGTVPSVPSEYPRSLPDSRGIPASVGKEVLVAPFNETERAVKIIEDNASELAAVIVEPLERVLAPEPGFLEAIREVTARHGIVLVFDEVVTGFRIAWGGAQERYGVVPDVATYGKAMAGGFPLAAVVGRADIMQVFNAQGVSSITDIAWASGHVQREPGRRKRRSRRAGHPGTAGVVSAPSQRGIAAPRRHRRGGTPPRIPRPGSGGRRRIRNPVHRERQRQDLDGLAGARYRAGPPLGHRVHKARSTDDPEREDIHLDSAHRPGRGPHAANLRRRIPGLRFIATAR